MRKRDNRHRKANVRAGAAPRRRRFLLFGALGAALAAGVIAIAVFGGRTGAPKDDAPRGEKAAAPKTVTTPPEAPLPTLPPALAADFERARSLMASGRAAEAVPELEGLLGRLRAGPADANAIALVHFTWCAALRKAQRKDDALHRAFEWLKEHPDDPTHNLIAGSLLYDEGRYGEAAPRLEAGIAAGLGAARRVATDPLSVLNQLADTYRNLGRTDDAQKTVERVLAEAPGDESARATLALIAYARRDYSKALDILEPLFAKKPEDPVTAFNLVRAAVDADRAPRAIEVVRAHIGAGGKLEGSLRLWYAKAFLAAGQSFQAVEQAAPLLILDPEYDDAYFVLADALARTGKQELARSFRDRYARTKELRGELERARTATRFGSPSSAAYYRGRALADAARYGAAIRELQKARGLAPFNGQVAGLLADVLVAIDRPFDAEDLLAGFERSSAEQGFPPPAEFFLAQANLAWSLGNKDAAVGAFRRACADERIERERARVGVLLAVIYADEEIRILALKPFEKQAEIDAEVKAWLGIKAFLAGENERAAREIEAALATLAAPDRAIVLALARANLGAGARAKAAEGFRSLIAKEELLRHAWEGLKAATDEPEEAAAAAAWLAGASEIEALLREEWARLRGEADNRRSSDALLRAAKLRDRLGMRRRACSLVALARDADPYNAETHRLALALFDRPEDAFVRLFSLEALRRIDAADASIEPLRRNEYDRLGFAAPDVPGASGAP